MKTNEINTHDDLEHYKGVIWISKIFKNEYRGNICSYVDNKFRVLAYISPSQLGNKTLDEVVYDTLKAYGTLWMLDDAV